ncbi:MAG: metallophosphoesterase [Desulfosarcinaceae bacterium]|nr:metallophosphoesterase [Desulfosarcinaceae bacterium]
MRILAVADLHGKAERLDTLAHWTAEWTPDAVIVAGDLAAPRDLVPALARLNTLALPVYLIAGNSDGRRLAERMAPFANLTRLSDAPLRCGEAHLTGLGGTLPLPFASRLCWRESARLARLAPAPRPFILVVHPPPHGVLDRVLGLHTGSRGLARWVAAHQPDLLVCGHVHERPGVALCGATTVVNCSVGRRGGGAAITIANGAHRVRMLPPL